MEKDNPNALKHFYGPDLLKRMAKALGAVEPRFDQKEFLALESQLGPLEMKPRVQLLREKIREELQMNLGADYHATLKILLDSTKSGFLSGFDFWPYTDFVQTYGIQNSKISLEALKELTCLFTAEFAIRPFLVHDLEATLKFLKTCAKSPNVHHRRWASEGTRPRLPWGCKLHDLVGDPSPCFPILELLKFDEELYVRKSVSNHLNDITKDHPEKVIQILKRWKKEAGREHEAKVNWIIHRALRTLIKAGDPGALKLIGVGDALIQARQLTLNKSKYKVGEKLEFEFLIKSKSSKKQKLVIDYIVHFAKANKKLSPKVFKFKTFELGPGETLTLRKLHSLKAISTRKYYSGSHALEIQINGKGFLKKEWFLKA